ncbi:MAG: ATP-binding cassette domain-containing protein [Coriobacteriales bacterium]|nr:ATP-binding cassette domain-containing protein [Coriobacteriales bacterium]
MIQIERLNKSFGSADNIHHVLHDIDLTINDGDVFGIIGSSGAGKSTLVRCINLLERPTSGKIIIDGKDVTNYKGKDLLDLRESIGMIFQNFSLFQQRSVLKNVTFPLEVNGKKMSKSERLERAHELLKLVELDDKIKQYPSQLSGGQQQRVAIARALVSKPKIMLCDEATSALDTKTTASILDLLGSINRELGVTMVMITHSLAVAQRVCNRIAVIDDGRIVEEGTTAQVFGNPQSPITKELLRNDNLTTMSQTGDESDNSSLPEQA